MGKTDGNKPGIAPFHKELETQLKVINSSSAPDPSTDWVNDFMSAEKLTKSQKAALDQVQEHIYASMKTAVSGGEEYKEFTKDEWSQLIYSMTVKGMDEDEKLDAAVKSDEGIKKQLRKLIAHYVLTDDFNTKLIDLIASVSKDRDSGGTIVGENQNPDDSVFLTTKGQVVRLGQEEGSVSNPVQAAFPDQGNKENEGTDDTETSEADDNAVYLVTKDQVVKLGQDENEANTSIQAEFPIQEGVAKEETTTENKDKDAVMDKFNEYDVPVNVVQVETKEAAPSNYGVGMSATVSFIRQTMDKLRQAN